MRGGIHRDRKRDIDMLARVINKDKEDDYIDLTEKTYNVRWLYLKGEKEEPVGFNCGCEISYSRMFGSDRDNTRFARFENAISVFIMENGRTVHHINPKTFK